MFPGEPNVSRIQFLDLHVFDASLVVYDDLDAHLVKHIRHQLVTGCVSHLHRLEQHSLLASVDILHINANEVIISRLSNECDVWRNVVPERLTHSSFNTRCDLFGYIMPSLFSTWRCSAPTMTPAEIGRQSASSQGSEPCKPTPGCHWPSVCEHL